MFMWEMDLGPQEDAKATGTRSFLDWTGGGSGWSLVRPTQKLVILEAPTWGKFWSDKGVWRVKCRGDGVGSTLSIWEYLNIKIACPLGKPPPRRLRGWGKCRQRLELRSGPDQQTLILAVVAVVWL
jgi:hypothetical protein